MPSESPASTHKRVENLKCKQHVHLINRCGVSQTEGKMTMKDAKSSFGLWFKLTFFLSKISSDDATRASVSRSCKRENIISSIFELVKWGKDLWLMTMTRLDVSMWKQRFHFSWNLVCGWIWQVKPSSTDEKQFPLNEAYRSLSSFDRAPNSISVREKSHACMKDEIWWNIN